MEINKKPVRLLRVTIAATLAQLIPLVILVAIITVYGYLAAPGQTQEIYEAFVKQAGKFTGPVAGTLATLGMAFWAARKQTNAWGVARHVNRYSGGNFRSGHLRLTTPKLRSDLWPGFTS